MDLCRHIDEDEVWKVKNGPIVSGEDDPGTEYIFYESATHGSHSLVIWRTRATNSWYTAAEFMLPHLDDAVQFERVQNMITNSTYSAGTWATISQRIADCTENHSLCRVNRDSRWKPTRLLDLGVMQSPDFVHLINSKDHFASDSIERFMTLSHAWGTLDFLRLQHDNFKALQQGIQITSLPKTFQDAIQVARQLRARHLWIDSLCIIQDDEDDWQCEAAQMADVYHNSFCNLAATAAPDGRSGLFFSRDPNTVQSPIVFPTWIEEMRRPRAVVNRFRTMHNFTNLPLLKRAWVTQERLLASRTIHFGNPQVFWECSERLASESLPSGFDDTILSAFSLTPPGTAVELLWKHIVEWYSQCSLSFPSDKLTALSGIASHLHRTSPNVYGQYFAGLWNISRPYELLWRPSSKKIVLGTSGVVKETLPVHRNFPYRGPSWSWVSVEAHIDILSSDPEPATMHRFLATNVSATWSLAGPDLFGAVTSACLHLHAPVAIVDFERYYNYGYQVFIDSITNSHGNIHDTRHPKAMARLGSPKVNGKIIDSKSNAFIVAEIQRSIYSYVKFDVRVDEPEIGEQHNTLALPLLVQQPHKDSLLELRSDDRSCHIDGLLLRHNAKGNLQRVGIFHFAVRNDQSEKLEYILSLFEERDLDLF